MVSSHLFPNIGAAALEEELKKSSVSVLGLGRSGISAVRVLKKIGAKVFVSESDKSPRTLKNLKSLKAAFEAGQHTEKILSSDLIVVSPGISPFIPILKKARLKKIPIINELELGFRLTRFLKIAAVTGTNGKTTVTSLVGELCLRNGWKTLVAGNIGNPLCDAVGQSQKYDCAILELSSYQLETIDQFRPNVSVILNLTEDHLRRHKTMAAYSKAKERIFLNQTKDDFLVLNASDPWCVKMGRRSKAKIIWFSAYKKLKEGVFYDEENKKIIVKLNSKKIVFDGPKNLLGMHNIENSAASIACALKMGVQPSAVREAMEKFVAVEHRLEKVRVINGVTYINDSKATNVDSALKAIDSFTEPLWLILGGEDKGSPYTPIKTLSEKRKKYRLGEIKGIFLIGEASKLIHSQLKGMSPIYFCRTMGSAVKKAFECAGKGDVVLLSPACASFDQYNNYEERGRDFKDTIKSINIGSLKN